MTLQLDGMEKALTEFAAKYRNRFDSLAWRWTDMNECEAELLIRAKLRGGKFWTGTVPVVGDDHGGFGGVLAINIDAGTPLFIDTLFEYLWGLSMGGVCGR